MQNKILIIGLGNMGMSHLESFIKKKFIIDIVENKNNKKINDLKKSKFFHKNITIFSKIPKFQKYLLTISATQSRERFILIKEFLARNKTKYLLLEKFCFLKLKDFEKFNKNLKKKTKTFVNSWGYILAKKTGLKKLKKFNITCQIEEGSLLANITHIMHVFAYFNNKINIHKIYETKFKVIKSTRRKTYNEILGTIKIEDINKNTLTITTKKKIKDTMIFTIRQTLPRISYKFIIKKNHQVSYYKSNFKFLEIKFPFSKVTSQLFVKKCENKNFDYMPSFENDYKLSTSLLKKFKVKIP